MSNPDINLFRDEEFEEIKLTPEKVVCLGMEFESDDARRAYFREELRKKLPELRQIEGFPIGEDEDIINNLQIEMGENDYIRYLEAISAQKTHAGYFSIDKKGRMVNSKVGRSETSSDDVNAYDSIISSVTIAPLKNKSLGL